MLTDFSETPRSATAWRKWSRYSVMLSVSTKCILTWIRLALTTAFPGRNAKESAVNSPASLHTRDYFHSTSQLWYRFTKPFIENVLRSLARLVTCHQLQVSCHVRSGTFSFRPERAHLSICSHSCTWCCIVLER